MSSRKERFRCRINARLGYASRRAGASRPVCRASSLNRDATREMAVPQRKKKTDARSPERKILEAWIRPEPEKPYYTTIRNAFIQRFANWYVSPLDVEQLGEEWTLLACLLFHFPPGTPKLSGFVLKTPFAPPNGATIECQGPKPPTSTVCSMASRQDILTC